MTSTRPDHLYFKITSPQTKVSINRGSTSITRLSILQYKFSGVPVVGDAPYTDIFMFLLPDQMVDVDLTNSNTRGVPIAITGANTFVQIPQESGFELRSNGTPCGSMNVEIRDADGNLAQFTEGHFWFSVK